jgi:hypothetical protein
VSGNVVMKLSTSLFDPCCRKVETSVHNSGFLTISVTGSNSQRRRGVFMFLLMILRYLLHRIYKADDRRLTFLVFVILLT